MATFNSNITCELLLKISPDLYWKVPICEYGQPLGMHMTVILDRHIRERSNQSWVNDQVTMQRGNVWCSMLYIRLGDAA